MGQYMQVYTQRQTIKGYFLINTLAVFIQNQLRVYYHYYYFKLKDIIEILESPEYFWHKLQS